MRFLILVLVACRQPAPVPQTLPPTTDHVSALTAAGVEQPAGMDWGPEGKKLAKTLFKNVQVLGDVSGDRFMAGMQSMQKSVGLKCDACHTKEDFTADNDEKKKARDMIRLTDAIAQRTFHGQPRVTCWTCHRGLAKPPARPVPEKLPDAFAQLTADELAQPVEQRYHDLKVLTGMDVRTFGQLMQWFATELGVECTHCHLKSDFAAMTPKKQRALDMLAMTAYIGKDFYNDKSPVMCGTCHGGSVAPPRRP